MIINTFYEITKIAVVRCCVAVLCKNSLSLKQCHHINTTTYTMYAHIVALLLALEAFPS